MKSVCARSVHLEGKGYDFSGATAMLDSLEGELTMRDYIVRAPLSIWGPLGYRPSAPPCPIAQRSLNRDRLRSCSSRTCRHGSSLSIRYAAPSARVSPP